MRRSSWPTALAFLLVLHLAGCFTPPSGNAVVPAAPPPAPTIEHPTATTLRWIERGHVDGNLATGACAPTGPNSCAWAAIAPKNLVSQLMLGPDAKSLEMTANWRANTPASQRFHIDLRCGEEWCPMLKPSFMEGPSPLRFNWTTPLPVTQLNISVGVSDPFSPVGLYGTVLDGSRFSLDWTASYARPTGGRPT